MKPRLCANSLVLVCMLTVTVLVSSCGDDEDPEYIEYAEIGFYGPNVLSTHPTALSHNQDASLQAKIPQGKKLKVVIKSLREYFPSGTWTIDSPNNWAVSYFNSNDNTQIFTSIDGGLTSTLRIRFEAGEFEIKLYEDDSEYPWTRSVVVTE